MVKYKLAYIVDDDPISIFGAKKIMQYAEVCDNFGVFHNGKEALLELLAKNQNKLELPEIIFLDLNMPVMDGWSFLEEFSKVEFHQNIKVYIVTSSIDPEDTQRAQEYRSVVNYIVKPVTVDKLREVL